MAWGGRSCAWAVGARGSGGLCRASSKGDCPDGATLHRGGGARRGGTDFEFSAPKSFSIQALVNGDRRLIDVHRRRWHRAATDRSDHRDTRTEKGSTRLEFTRSAVIAQFEHATSRAGDPDLHSHVVVLNLTRRADGQWRSIENAEMFKEQRLMYEIYLSELAKGAKDLGYGITIGKHGNPELAHITREQIEHFSRRSREVEAELRIRRADSRDLDAAAKRAAALSTRAAKQRYDHAALTNGMDGTRPARRAAADFCRRKGRVYLPVRKARIAREAVGFAMEHLSERQAAFSRRDATRGGAACRARSRRRVERSPRNWIGRSVRAGLCRMRRASGSPRVRRWRRSGDCCPSSTKDAVR